MTRHDIFDELIQRNRMILEHQGNVVRETGELTYAAIKQRVENMAYIVLPGQYVLNIEEKKIAEEVYRLFDIMIVNEHDTKGSSPQNYFIDNSLMGRKIVISSYPGFYKRDNQIILRDFFPWLKEKLNMLANLDFIKTL